MGLRRGSCLLDGGLRSGCRTVASSTVPAHMTAASQGVRREREWVQVGERRRRHSLRA